MSSTPQNHDLVLIGASAGGLEPLREILRALPASLPATIFIVMHIGTASYLAPILCRHSALPVRRASQGERFATGRVYVAAPEQHILLHDGHILLTRGPRENMSRPAIDPLFRSAAASYGGRVIGVVLSGGLNDGTAGLAAIKRCGGIAVVQDPADAAEPDMPQSALRHVAVDHRAPAGKMAELLRHLVAEPAGTTPDIPLEIRLEAAIATQETREMVSEDRLGKPAPFSCPECGGTLWEIDDPGMLRFRCRVGHAYTAEAMQEAQNGKAEELLWRLLRSHEERAALTRRMAEKERGGPRRNLADLLERRAIEYETDAQVIRRLLRQDDLGADASEGQDPSSAGVPGREKA